jgi:hypothetical protein
MSGAPDKVMSVSYYADLSEYTYIELGIRAGTQNVGWLAPDHAFPTASPGEELLDLLWRYCKISVAQTRGIHECELCRGGTVSSFERHGETLLLGSSEIRVFSSTGAIYAAPTLIYHYVSSHGYAPPEAFLHALAQPPVPPDPAYSARLQQLGLAWNATSMPGAAPRKLWE